MIELTTAERAELSLRMVREAHTLSYDIESSGVDWKRNFPCGYVFCDTPNNSIYIPTRHGGGGNLDANTPLPQDAEDWGHLPTAYEVALGVAFADRERLGKRTVGHNLKFDCHFSLNVGIRLGRVLSCTQNNAVLLGEYERAYSLDAVAQRMNVTAKLGDVLYGHLAAQFGCAATRASMGNYWRLSGEDPIGVEYAVGDGVTTLEVYQKQYHLLEQEELLEVKALEDELIWTLVRIERRGMAVDIAYLQELKELLQGRLAEAMAALPAGFNPRSPKAVKNVCELAERFDWPLTEKGNPSFTEAFLKSFPEGQRIVSIRQNSNLINTFIEPMMTRHVFKGRVHASLNQLKNGSQGTPARLSCSNPNMQQIPKRNYDLATLLRKAFKPDPGFKFYEADYSQAEPRLFAHYSREPSLINGYMQKPFKDMHSVVAELMGVERDPTGKRMNQGILTGMFPNTFAQHMGWSLEEATDKWNQWFEVFPGIREFQNTAKGVMSSRGFVRTLLGRKGRMEAPRFNYKATSKLIQGGSADIMKYKLLQVDKMLEERGDPAHLLMTIHDSLEFQCPDTPEGEAIAEEILAVMADLQSEPFNLRVPFVVDVDSGKNWCEATFGAQNE